MRNTHRKIPLCFFAAPVNTAYESSKITIKFQDSTGKVERSHFRICEQHLASKLCRNGPAPASKSWNT